MYMYDKIISACQYSKSLSETSNPTSADVELPMSRYDTLLAFAKARCAGMKDCGLVFDRTNYDRYPNLYCSLLAFNDNTLTFDDVNHLAKRLVEIGPDGRKKMEGMIRASPPKSMKDLIDMTFRTDGVLYIPAANPDALGRHLVETGYMHFDDDFMPYINYASIGEKYIAEHGGAFSADGYFRSTKPPTTNQSNGVAPSQEKEPKYVFLVRLAKYNSDMSELRNSSFFIPLPCNRGNTQYEDDLNIYTDQRGYMITHIETAIEAFDPLLDGEIDLDLLNGLADEIAKMDDALFVKYMALLEHSHVLPVEEHNDPIKTLGQCCYYAACVKDYDFFPEITTPAQYGEQEFYRMHGIANTSANGMDFFDYHGYGSACMELDNATVTSYGLIRNTGQAQTEESDNRHNDSSLTGDMTMQMS